MLIASDEACVINISSVNGFWACLGASTPHTAYSTAKFAVKGFSEALIEDLRTNAPHVRVAVVMPGHVGTNIIRNSVRALGVTETDEIAKINAEFRDRASLSPADAATIILDGVRAGAWRILVGIEMLAAVPWGLGWLIFGAQEFLNTDVMLAGIAVIALIGLALEKLVFQKLEEFTVVRWGMLTS